MAILPLYPTLGEASRMNFEAQDTAAKRNDVQAKDEDTVLLEAGFKRTESNLLWERNSVLYGREAALQSAFKEIEKDTLDES